MSTVTVRPFVHADFEAVTQVWHDSAHEAFPWVTEIQRHSLEDDRAYFRRHYLDKADVWVGELDGRVAGLMVLFENFVDQLYIAPSAQRQGLGDALVRKAKELWPSGLRLYTFQANEPARRLYEKHGFAAIHFGVSPAPENEPDVEYHWPGDEAARSDLSPSTYLDALMSLPSLWGPRTSPDGRRVAWTWFRAGPTADVYVAPTDGSAGPLRLTDTTEDTYLVSWSPDSRAVLVEQDESGNERVQLFRVDLDAPRQMQALTEPGPGYFIRGGELHPDGRTLVYGANVDAITGAEIEPTWVYAHDLHTGARRVLARPERGGYLVPQLSPDGRHVLYHRRDRAPGGTQVWLVGIDGDGDREILDFGADVKTHGRWLADSSGVLFLTDTPTHRKLGLWRLDDGSVRWLIDDPARNIEDAYQPRDSSRFVVVDVRSASRRCSLLNPTTGEETPFMAGSGNLIPLAPVPGEEGMWTAQYHNSRQPTEVVRVRVPGSGPRASLSRVWERTTLTAADLTHAVGFAWTADDGLPLHGWLYRPPTIPIGTIVYVHGGPTYHSEHAVNPQIQAFVRRGFTVLDPNYRGSTGYGVAFREAIKADGWGGREQTDIRAGIEQLIRLGLAEPGKVGMTGTSYGGYSSWWAITHFPIDILAAAAPICGMTDLVLDYDTTRPDLRPYSEEMLGGRPDQVPERYRERSPIHYVDQIVGRLLIVQGEKDPNVTPENVRAVREALHRAEIDYELLTFPDEGHGIGRPANQRILYARLADFFEAAFQQAQ